jgi:hypothetical protein
MDIYFILLITTIVSGALFGIFVRLLNFIPKKYHKSIELMSSVGLILVISGTFITYYKEESESSEREQSDYADKILYGFEKIDDFLIHNYDSLSPIFGILYNKISFPSSDTNLNLKFKNVDKKIKDMLFIIYGKLTIIFEKMFLINPHLFNNQHLGVRVKLYTESMFYYEYWNSTKSIYNTQFVKFMDDKYKFLTLTNHKYNKQDTEIYRVAYISDDSFIFKSPKSDRLWY